MDSEASSKTSAARPASFPRLSAIRWLTAALAGSLLGPAALVVYIAWDSYEAAVVGGRLRLARVAQIAQQQAARVVETNEVISRAVTGALAGQDNAKLRQRSEELHLQLKGLAGNLPQLQSIWIWDETGHPVASSLTPHPPATLNVADREYFRHAAASTDGGWFVSEPLRSKLTGQPFFDFSKRREGAGGRFEGVLSVSLFPSYFGGFFKELSEQDPAFAISLLRTDGTVISRFPEVGLATRLGPQSPLLQGMRNGEAKGETSGTSTIDGKFRFVAYRRVGALPLYVAATADRDRLLAPWRRSTLLLAAITLPLALLLAGLCAYAIRRVRRENELAAIHEQEYEQRLKAERALRQSQKMEALGRLTAGVAQDFNNLLMVVQNSAALAERREERGERAAPALAPIRRAVGTGAQLTRQLLAFARRQPMQVAEVSLGSLLPSTAQLVRSSLGRAYEIEVAVEPGLPTVLADEAELELALINLCINARDAMPDGGRIRIEAASAEGDPQRVVVRVRDHGQGIAPELLEKVLEPFFTTKPIGRGTGLGLSQVQSCVDQAGGSVRIESTQGEGTTVCMSFRAGVRAGAAPRSAEVQEVRLHGMLVLVEDNDDIAESLTFLLTESGMQVRRFASAEAAWEDLSSRRQAADAVLSDISLAGEMTGVDLAALVSGQLPHLPVVLMTGYTDRLAQAGKLGLQVLSKPVSPEALVKALSDVLGQREGVGGAPLRQ